MQDSASLPRRRVQWAIYDRFAREVRPLPAEVSSRIEIAFRSTEMRVRIEVPHEEGGFDVDLANMRICRAGGGPAQERPGGLRGSASGSFLRTLRQVTENDTPADGPADRRRPYRAASAALPHRSFSSSAHARHRALRELEPRAPPPPRAAPPPQEPWSCEACTLINEPRHMYCAVCGTPNRASLAAIARATGPARRLDGDDGFSEWEDGDNGAPYPSHHAPYASSASSAADYDMLTFLEALRLGEPPPALEPPPPAAQPPPPPPPPRRRQLGASNRPRAGGEDGVGWAPRRGSIMSIFHSARNLLRSEPSSRSESVSSASSVSSPESSTGPRSRSGSEVSEDAAARERSSSASSPTLSSGRASPVDPRDPRRVLSQVDWRGRRLFRRVELPEGERSWEVWQVMSDGGWESLPADASETLCAAVAFGWRATTANVMRGAPPRPYSFRVDLRRLCVQGAGRFSGRPVRVDPDGGQRALNDRKESKRRAVKSALQGARDVTHRVLKEDPYAECSICLFEFDTSPHRLLKEACGSGCPCAEAKDFRALQLRGCKGHAFHEACLVDWWGRVDSEVCPICGDN